MPDARIETLTFLRDACHDQQDAGLRAACNRAIGLLIAAAPEPARAADARQWQPIATVPRDGRAVLVMSDDWPGTKSGRAEDCNGHNTYVAEWWANENDEHVGEWVCYMDWPKEPRCPIKPTHWMPLPAPPMLEVRVAEDKPPPAPEGEAARWCRMLREWAVAADDEKPDFCADDCDELARLVERLAEGRG